jgi:hypothetical protein
MALFMIIFMGAFLVKYFFTSIGGYGYGYGMICMMDSFGAQEGYRFYGQGKDRTGK